MCFRGWAMLVTRAQRNVRTGIIRATNLKTRSFPLDIHNCQLLFLTAFWTLGNSRSCLTPGLLSGSRDIINWITRLSSGWRCKVRLGSGPFSRRLCHNGPPLGRSISVANSNKVTPRLKISQAFVNFPARTSGAR